MMKHGTEMLNVICKFDILIFWMLYLKWLRKGKLIWDDEKYASLMLNEIMIYFTYVFIPYMIFLDYWCSSLVCRDCTMGLTGNQGSNYYKHDTTKVELVENIQNTIIENPTYQP